VLGAHVTQAGSLVAPDRLRFDFNHNAPLTREERQRVEDIVNTKILSDLHVRPCPMAKEEAQKKGAMMLFGEKYGEEVRAVSISSFNDCDHWQDAWSMELCGGTHVHSTGQIGLFKIISQASVSAGVRRIEAVAGLPALEAIRRMEHQLAIVAESLKTTPDELLPRIDRLRLKKSFSTSSLRPCGINLMKWPKAPNPSAELLSSAGGSMA
jgi:alanyl-tRNA synthetase